MISDNAKNKQFCDGVRQDPFFFSKFQFFRSAGNVIQQIKKVSPQGAWNNSSNNLVNSRKSHLDGFMLYL